MWFSVISIAICFLARDGCIFAARVHICHFADFTSDSGLSARTLPSWEPHFTVVHDGTSVLHKLHVQRLTRPIRSGLNAVVDHHPSEDGAVVVLRVFVSLGRAVTFANLLRSS